jgi:hypothetical protein
MTVGNRFLPITRPQATTLATGYTDDAMVSLFGLCEKRSWQQHCCTIPVKKKKAPAGKTGDETLSMLKKLDKSSPKGPGVVVPTKEGFMGQVKIDVDGKNISIPYMFFFSKKFPLQETEKTLVLDTSGGAKVYKVHLKGGFGEQDVTFNDYESYLTFVYDWQRAMMAS